MFKIGDLLIYSTHGICKVKDIREKTVSDITRSYYILQPMINEQELTISTPVDNKNVIMKDLVTPEVANEILESFKEKGVEWEERPNVRRNLYTSMVNKGDRKEIAAVVNTLLRREIEAKETETTFHKQDQTLLQATRDSLFNELAISLDTTYQDMNKKISKYIRGDFT